MKRSIASAFVMMLILMFSGCTDKGQAPAKGAFPSTIEEIERMNRDQIAALPDIKAPLGATLDESALTGKNKVMLRIMRNSIFAQYGYPFTVKWLRDYFETRSWYRSGNFNAGEVKPVDTANVRLIEQYEDKINPSGPFDRIERMGAGELKHLPDIRAALDSPIDESTLKYMGKRELKILRNSIYAQYGRSFVTPWLQGYFNSRSWYKRRAFSDTMLTQADLKNVELIKRYETAGENIAEREILRLAYCERESDYELERYVFKSGNALEYSVESQSPYGRSSAEHTRSGEWRVAPGGIEYRFEASAEWEPLEVEIATHLCR